MLKRLFGARTSAPDSADACFRLGSELAQRGELDQAITLLRGATELAPHGAGAYHNLGSAYRDRGDAAAALGAFRKAAHLDPNFAEAHYGVGLMLMGERRYEEALASLRRASELNPRLAEARFEAGNAHMGLGDWQAAIAEFKAAIDARPDYAEARWARAMSQLPAVYAFGTEPAERRHAFSTQLDALGKWLGTTRRADAYLAVGVHQPFYLAYQEAPNRELLAKYGALCAGQMAVWQSRAGLTVPARRQADQTHGKRRGKPRIGIVSAHVHEHSVWTALVRGWIEGLAAANELHIFHLGAMEDAETKLARRRAGRFEAGPRPFDAWAHAIHGPQLDLLLYPEIGMDATTAKLASLRLAPVQAASWGHPETSGLPTIDYYFSAQALEPADAQANYTEKLVALPNLGAGWSPPGRSRASRRHSRWRLTRSCCCARAMRSNTRRSTTGCSRRSRSAFRARGWCSFAAGPRRWRKSCASACASRSGAPARTSSARSHSCPGRAARLSAPYSSAPTFISTPSDFPASTPRCRPSSAGCRSWRAKAASCAGASRAACCAILGSTSWWRHRTRPTSSSPPPWPADREHRQELRRRIEGGRERLYRDREPLEALQRFIETVVS